MKIYFKIISLILNKTLTSFNAIETNGQDYSSNNGILGHIGEF